MLKYLVCIVFLCGCAGLHNRYYTVLPGDTLSGIAGRHAVPLAALVAHNAGLSARSLSPGIRVYIPYESRPGWQRPVEFSDRKPTAVGRGGSGGGFEWPIQGPISSPFGRRRGRPHEGVDIVGRRGTSVHAARSGHVIYSGNGIRGYGNLVILRHVDGFSTVYAHLNRIKVRRGQYVNRGQVVGGVGRTGRATGDHLHFEIRENRVAVDPLLYLQRRYAANILPR